MPKNDGAEADSLAPPGAVRDDAAPAAEPIDLGNPMPDPAAIAAERDAALVQLGERTVEVSVLRAKLREVEDENIKLRILGTKLNIQLQSAMPAAATA